MLIIVILMVLLVLERITPFNFKKQIYKFQSTVQELLKAFGCCSSLVHNELGNISHDMFPN